MITTIVHRPYVFAFLIAFLVLGRIYWGWRKTFIWLIIGYVVAWISEFSSIHNGFPYGLYHYIYENMTGELMVAGVPFWDSLSYPFMIFAGYTTAKFILRHPEPLAKDPVNVDKHQSFFATLRMTAPAALLGALLTMLLDVIIDPLTVLGDKWFLGKIYYYPNGGQYFGVPLTNFAGWFLVPLVVIILFLFVVAKLEIASSPLGTCNDKHKLTHFLNPLFYLAIAIFNIIITIYIGETLLASINCLLLIPVVYLIKRRVMGFQHTP
jgi:putative membrane protein